MGRIARIIYPGMPHHIVHRGNRHEKVFFNNIDRKRYLSLLAEACKRYMVEVWSWCLMTNHLHLLLSPADLIGLAKVMQCVAHNYALKINKQHNWAGRLWEVRYYSCVVHKDSYLWTVSGYIETNPVRAGLVAEPEQWEWSSARAHFLEKPDKYLKLKEWLDNDEREAYKRYVYEYLKQENIDKIQRTTNTGRPLGTDDFITELEKRLGRELRPKKAGRKIRK